MAELMNEILRDIGRLARSIQSICDIKFKKLNLQKGQFIFLTRICECPGINLIELSNMLKVDKTTTTKVVQKLIGEGYIYKTRDINDKRMWHLFPSKKVMEIYTYVIDEENRSITICLAGLSSNEKAEAQRLLRIMGENIESEWKEVKNYRGEYND